MGYIAIWPSQSVINLVYDRQIYKGNWDNLIVLPNEFMGQVWRA